MFAQQLRGVSLSFSPRRGRTLRACIPPSRLLGGLDPITDDARDYGQPRSEQAYAAQRPEDTHRAGPGAVIPLRGSVEREG